MNLLGQEVVFIAFFLPLLPVWALKSAVMNYVVQSAEVLNCEDMCPENETFVPALPNEDGTCPSDTMKIDFSKPLSLNQTCEIDMLPTNHVSTS